MEMSKKDFFIELLGSVADQQLGDYLKLEWQVINDMFDTYCDILCIKENMLTDTVDCSARLREASERLKEIGDRYALIANKESELVTKFSNMISGI